MLRPKRFKTLWANIVVYSIIISVALYLVAYAILFDSRWGLLSN